MTLGFFILSALDLLSAGADTSPEYQKTEIRAWILKCQHPHGGFCGSPNHKYPDGFYKNGEAMDPANLPATFFAILSLGFVGGLEGVKRRECLEWLRRLQRDDGSFGELVTPDGKVQGGQDMRHCYVASAVRWMLRGDVPAGEKLDGDINVEGLVGHLRNGQVGKSVSTKRLLADENRRMMEAFLKALPMKHMVRFFFRCKLYFLTTSCSWVHILRNSITFVAEPTAGLRNIFLNQGRLGSRLGKYPSHYKVACLATGRIQRRRRRGRRRSRSNYSPARSYGWDSQRPAFGSGVDA